MTSKTNRKLRVSHLMTSVVSLFAIAFAVVACSQSDIDDLLSGVGSSGGGGNTSSAPSNAWINQPLRVNDAKAALARIPVKGKGPKTGYSRDQFGTAWTDKVNVEGGNNGCSTRDDILARDMKPYTHDSCTVKSGTLFDPYTGKSIQFVRGPKTSSVVQIDHLVALGNAWVSGADRLSITKRTELANDPLNLVAADGPANGQKQDKNAAEWLPPNKEVRCRYAVGQALVKGKYGLSMTSDEKRVVTDLIGTCRV